MLGTSGPTSAQHSTVKRDAGVRSGRRAPARAHPAAERDRELPVGGQRDARAEHLKPPGLERLEQCPVRASHDLGGEEAGRVGGGQRGPGLFVILACARRLCRHQLDESGRIAPRGEILRADVEAAQILLGQVDAPRTRVDLDVAQDIRELQRDAEVHRVIAGAGIAVAEDLDAREPDGGRHAVAVRVQLLERLVAGLVQVHLDARDDLFEHGARDRKGADRRLESLASGVRGRATVDACDLLTPALELAPLPVALLPEVDGVVHDAAERVHRVERLALPAWQAEEGVEEVRAALPREP